MRMRNITMWLGAAALVYSMACLATPVRAQALGTAAEVSATSGPSEVQAEVNASVRSDGAAGFAGVSGIGGGSRMAAHSDAGSSNPAAPHSGLQSHHGADALASGAGRSNRVGGSGIGAGRSMANRLTMLKKQRAIHSAHRPKALDPALARAMLKSALVGRKPGKIHGNVTGIASYSDSFPDSTKGTALVSPPDPGTAGPFAFNTELNVKLPDFADRQFLAPSLDVGQRSSSGKTKRRNAVNRAKSPAFSQQASPDEDLGLDVLRGDLGTGFAPDPASDLGATLSTSVQPQ